MSSTPEWVKVGAKVMQVTTSGWGDTRYGPVTTISKVYKTGNFLLEGDSKQQWRPLWDYAVKTGEGYSRASIHMHPVTPELLAERDQVLAVSLARKIVRDESDRLSKINDEDELIAAAAAITERMK